LILCTFSGPFSFAHPHSSAHAFSLALQFRPLSSFDHLDPLAVALNGREHEERRQVRVQNRYHQGIHDEAMCRFDDVAMCAWKTELGAANRSEGGCFANCSKHSHRFLFALAVE
jgi:hypothetical protein